MSPTELETLQQALDKTVVRHCVDCGAEIYVKPYRLRQNPNGGLRCGECNGKKFHFGSPKPQASTVILMSKPITVGYCSVCGFPGDGEFTPKTLCPKCGMVYLEPFEKKIVGLVG